MDDDSPLFSELPEGPALDAAVARARATLSAFVAAFVAAKYSGQGFLVKLPLVADPPPDGPRIWMPENATRKPDLHLWLRVRDCLEDLLFVHVVESPRAIAGLEAGTAFVVGPAAVEDWATLSGGVLYGGYSLRLVRSRLSASERADFDLHIGIDSTGPIFGELPAPN